MARTGLVSPRGGGYKIESISMASDYLTTADQAWDIPYKATVSVQLTWSGGDAFNATLILEESNDGVNWDESNGSGYCIETASGSVTWTYTGFPSRYLRLNYQANNMSTGTMNVYIFAKREA